MPLNSENSEADRAAKTAFTEISTSRTVSHDETPEDVVSYYAGIPDAMGRTVFLVRRYEASNEDPFYVAQVATYKTPEIIFDYAEEFLTGLEEQTVSGDGGGYQWSAGVGQGLLEEEAQRPLSLRSLREKQAGEFSSVRLDSPFGAIVYEAAPLPRETRLAQISVITDIDAPNHVVAFLARVSAASLSTGIVKEQLRAAQSKKLS